MIVATLDSPRQQSNLQQVIQRHRTKGGGASHGRVHNESVRSTRLVGVPIVLAGFGGLIEVASVANDASATPDPAGQLDAVSCTGLSYCLAVGTAVAWWNGQRWTVVAKPARRPRAPSRSS